MSTLEKIKNLGNIKKGIQTNLLFHLRAPTCAALPPQWSPRGARRLASSASFRRYSPLSNSYQLFVRGSPTPSGNPTVTEVQIHPLRQRRNQNKKDTAWCPLFCLRAVKRCIKVGKNSKKVFITLICFSFALFFLGYVKTKNLQSV